MNYDKLSDHNLLKQILIRKGWRVEEWSAGEMLFRPDGGEVSSIIDILEIPDYVKKIEKAWELVDEATKDGVGFELYTIHDINHYWYHAQFYDPPQGPMNEVYDAEEDAATRAICIAWLKLKDKQL